MELIFYDKAAEILGVTVGTLAHAVSRGELTRAGMQGSKQRLIKEQVTLFAGINPRTGHKKRISYDALSEQEKALWHRYANEMNSASTTPAPPDLEKLIDEKIREELARQELARIAEQKREIARQEERFRKEYPFLKERNLIPV